MDEACSAAQEVSCDEEDNVGQVLWETDAVDDISKPWVSVRYRALGRAFCFMSTHEITSPHEKEITWRKRTESD